MAYIWKYHSHDELLEGEENDIQICVTERERHSFLTNITKCIENENFSFKIMSLPLPVNSPYHIDEPSNNFYLPNTQYRSLTVYTGKSKDEVVNGEDLVLKLTKDSLRRLVDVIEETITAPSLYENVLELKSTPVVKLVSWGCYEGKPVYF